MIRERVSNQGAIPRRCLITDYDAFVLINKYDASDAYLYKKDFTNYNSIFYIRYIGDKGATIELFDQTNTFDIFDENYDAFIAENVVATCDVEYDKKPYNN